MKIKFLIMLLTVGALAHHNSFALKRKFEAEKEKETEEVKKPRIEEFSKIGRLQQLAAQQVIDTFLQTKNEKELQQVRNDYERLVPEMKEYITLLINAPNAMGETYLHNAKNYWQIEQLKWLGADPEKLSKLKQTPFISILAKGNIDAAEAFLKVFNEDPEILKDITGFTTLHYAIIADAYELLQKMFAFPGNNQRIQHHINQLVGDDPGFSPLILAALYSPRSLPLLLDNGATIDLPDDNGVTPLLYAAEHQPLEIVQFLIHKGAQLDAIDNDAENALFYAAKGNNIEVINYLVKEKQFNVNRANAEETSVLGVALDHGATVDTITTLINLGASVNDLIEGEYEMTSFLIRTRYDEPDLMTLVTLFIEHGAYLNYPDEESYPLAEAIFENYDITNHPNNIRKDINYDLVKYLIDHGAKIMLGDKDTILKSEDQKLIDLLQNVEILEKAPPSPESMLED